MTALGFERRVQADLACAGWVTYLPMDRVKLTRTRCVGGARVSWVRRPTFPRYFFAACLPGGDIAAPAELPFVVAVRRREDPTASMVHPVALMLLSQSEWVHDDERAATKAKGCAFDADEQVVIVHGPLKGWEARVAKVLSKRKVQIRYSLFGRDREAMIETDRLRPLDV